MNFGLKSKTISFIGLFFLASISLHSFAHIDEAPLTVSPQLECLTCHYEASSDVEVFVFIPTEILPPLVDLKFFQAFSFPVHKTFNSPAPPSFPI